MGRGARLVGGKVAWVPAIRVKGSYNSSICTLQSDTKCCLHVHHVLCRTQHESAAQLAALNAERDDLKALLLASLQRLEAVDEMVARADMSSSVMQVT